MRISDWSSDVCSSDLLNVQGIRLKEVRVVADDREAIVEAVNVLRGRNDYLFTTGGIGPTHDDITVDSIAAAVGVDVVIHPRARAALEAYYTDNRPEEQPSELQYLMRHSYAVSRLQKKTHDN